jgi:hypothetical protein
MTDLTYKNQLINQRDSDGYVNGTDMCQANGCQISEWLSNSGTQSYIQALSLETGIPCHSLHAKVSEGFPAKTAYWLHPLLALNLGRWISPQFAIWCDRHIKVLMETGTTALAAPQKPLSIAEMKAIVKQKEEQRLRVLETSVNGNDYFIGLRGKVKQLQSEFEQLNNSKTETLGYLRNIDTWIGFFKKEIEQLKSEVAQLKESASIHDTPAMAMTRLKHAQQMELLERQHELRRIERAEKAQEAIKAKEEKKQFEIETEYSQAIERLLVLAKKHNPLSARDCHQSGSLKDKTPDEVRAIFKFMADQGIGSIDGEGKRLKFSLNQDNSQN